jgi:nucleotide-binding universal stress UspA family protein
MKTEPTILIAVDFPMTAVGFEPVFDLAKATGWPVNLLHAAAPEPAFLGYDDEGGVYDKERRGSELTDEHEQLAANAASFAAAGIQTEAHVVVGPTVEVILDKAKEWNAAQIVVVGHKHNVAHRLALGSVASALLKVSPIPVLVLPTSIPTTEPGFTAAVDRLIDLIDRGDQPSELGELRQAAEAQLEEPSSAARRTHLLHQLRGDGLRESLRHFETDHPSLTRAINDVSYYLSGMGI